MVKFLFGGGWWTAWYVVMWLLSGMFLWIPLYALYRDAVPKAAGPASLGSVAMAVSVAMYFAAVTPINMAIGARLSGQGWIVTVIISLAACAAAMVGSYLAVAEMAYKGGYPRSALAVGVSVLLFVLNLAALAYGRASANSQPAAAEAASARESTTGGGVLGA